MKTRCKRVSDGKLIGKINTNLWVEVDGAYRDTREVGKR